METLGFGVLGFLAWEKNEFSGKLHRFFSDMESIDKKYIMGVGAKMMSAFGFSAEAKPFAPTKKTVVPDMGSTLPAYPSRPPFCVVSERAVVLKAIDQIKSLIGKNKFHLIMRSDGKTNKCLTFMGYNDPSDQNKFVKGELRDLKLENYCNGPNTDYDTHRGGVYWLFGRDYNIKGSIYQVYIKITLEHDGKPKVSVISFHEGFDMPYAYPR